MGWSRTSSRRCRGSSRSSLSPAIRASPTKGKAVDIKQVGRELGVRYVLEGSVRKAGGRVRIAGQLIDAATGAHLWADRFDGALDDIFALQDSVTQLVVGAISPELDRAEIERARRRPSGNIDAVTEVYRGLPHIHWPTSPENNDAALQHFRNAIALDPTFPPAYGCAAICLMWRRVNRWPADFASDDAELLCLADRVKELGTDDAGTLSGIGFALFHNRVTLKLASKWLIGPSDQIPIMRRDIMREDGFEFGTVARMMRLPTLSRVCALVRAIHLASL